MTRRLPLPRTARTRLTVLVALAVVIAAWPGAEGQPDLASNPSPTWSSAIAEAADLSPRATSTPEPDATATAREPTEVTRASASVRRTPPPGPTQSIQPGAAVTTLATLAVKGRAPRTGYGRDQFGRAWADVDRNGCDTRNDILRRDLTGEAIRSGTRGCLVLRGALADPYTGRTILFVRGPGTSSAVQIDHVVPLADAWQKGAQRWSSVTREAFANDPLNLQAVDGPTSLRKGAGDAATWLPPRPAVRCGYVARQVAVKHRYGLWVTDAERDAMVRILQACPHQELPTSGGSSVMASSVGGGSTTHVR